MKTPIYLSAQPDDFFFTWQLEIQINNFLRLGISPGQIHILVAYHPKRGIRKDFRELMDRRQSDACFFAYPDLRTETAYVSSIRPHLIAKHLKQYPALNNTPVFYHDSDILFRELPDWKNKLEDDTWYLSATNEYMNVAHLTQTGSESLFREMCAAVGISPAIIISNDSHTGGAQYLLKNTGSTFWEKVAHDSETLFNLIQDHNNQQADQLYVVNGSVKSAHKGVQAWCADMWSLLWNALLSGHPVKTCPELDFCWLTDPIEDWYKTRILHYTGIRKSSAQHVFYKREYLYFPPYFQYEEQHYSDSCSYPVIKEIISHQQTLLKKRSVLPDVTFLVSATNTSMEKALSVVRYLNKYIDAAILILTDASPTTEQLLRWPANCQLLNVTSGIPLTLLPEELSSREILAILPMPEIIPIQQILTAVDELRTRRYDIVFPHDRTRVYPDQITRSLFDRILDADMLLQNINKYTIPEVNEEEGPKSFFTFFRYIHTLYRNGAHLASPVIPDHFVTQFITGPVFKL